MATEVGIISALIGTANATATDGTVRTLQIGDKVYPNEIITTGLAGAVEVEFLDGSVMDLGRNSQAVLDNETFDFDNTTPSAATADSELFDDIEAIQQALLAGADPTEIADPTAAGPGAQPSSEGGSDTVVVDYLAPRVTPQAGFDTTGPEISFPDPPPVQFLVDGSDEPSFTPGEDPLDPEDPTPPGEEPIDPEDPTPPGEEAIDPEDPTPPGEEPIDPEDPTPPGEEPPGEPSLNTPPVADPVLTSYSFSIGVGEYLPADSYIFQKFTVGGGVDESEFGLKSPTIFEAEPSLGGDDGPDGTPESSLIFTLTTAPAFGTLYKKVDNDWIALKAGEEGKDTFSAGDSVIWSATQEEVKEHLESIAVGGMSGDSSVWNSVVLIARDLDDNIANIAYDDGGIGVEGGTIVPNQLEHRDGKSESIEVKFSNLTTEATIHVGNLIGPEQEVGQVEARLNGVVIGTWLFTSSYSNKVQDANGDWVDIHFTARSGFKLSSDNPRGEGSFELRHESGEWAEFDTLVFTARPYGDRGNFDSNDSSDYYIKSIEAKALPSVNFEYKVTDEDGLSSDDVVVTIKSAATGVVEDGADNTLIGADGDNFIIGGGNEILTGGAGEDIFVWKAGDEGTAEAPARDIVTDFNVAEGDVLDFSDILVGEELGNLTDFISITEDGADIVIELKPDANDVKQVVTLQDTSLADFGMGGYDTATQQADIINKLVQDGHVNVDS